MMSTTIDKSQAMITFLQTCPTIQANPLFFNFGNVEDGAHQAITKSDDVTTDKHYIDGSVQKRYTFIVDSFKSTGHNPVISGATDENVSDFAEVQAVLDWINTQGDNQNFPSFGDDCIIETMKTLTAKPDLYGVDTNQNPPVAIYRISIQIEYIDTTKRLWN